MTEPRMMVASAPPLKVFVLGLLYMAFSFYDSGDSWSYKLSKSIAIIAYTLEEFATERCGSLHKNPPGQGISPYIPVL